MSTGVYEEKLPCGGKLRVTRESWEIAYYFPGPDLRHKGAFLIVSGSAVGDYISAFEENFEEFNKLKAVIPDGGDFSKPGKRGMTIRVGLFNPGVCIQSYHMPISSPSQLERITEGYRYALGRAPTIQGFLASL